MRNVLAWKTSMVCIHNVQILGTPQESNGWIHRFTALVHISSLWWILYVISLVIYVEKRWEQPLMISGMTQVCCERFLFKKDSCANWIRILLIPLKKLIHWITVAIFLLYELFSISENYLPIIYGWPLILKSPGIGFRKFYLERCFKCIFHFSIKIFNNFHSSY